MGHSNLKLRLICATAMAASMAAGLAHAETAAPSRGDATTLQEVVVTATKRSERLHDVPLSVTAVSAEDLATRQQLNIVDISRDVPGFSVQQFGPTLNRMILRGENSGGAGATVAVTVDDVPFSFSGATGNGAIVIADVDPFDLDRVEVLRGPQGTLYGATAEGGIIKYVTAAPSTSRHSFGVEVGGETLADGGSAGDIRGYANLPLSDTFAIRVGGFYQGLPGYIDNTITGEKDVNHGRKVGGRIEFLFQPNPDLTIRGAAFYQKTNVNGPDYVAVVGAPLGPPGPANQLDLINGLSIGARLPMNTVTPFNVDYLNIEYRMPWATLHSITSYGRLGTDFNIDISATPIAPGFTYSDFLGAFVYGQPIALGEYERNTLRKISQEFRLTSNPGQQLFGHQFEFQGGVFFTQERGLLFQQFDAYALSNLSTPLSPPLGGDAAPSTYKEISGFGEVDFHFNPVFDISAGVRLTNVKQAYHTEFYPGILTGPGSIAPTTNSNETSTTFSVAPRWKLSDNTTIYTRVASGFRPGGPIGAVPGAPPDFPTSFTSDSTVNYEAGLRTYLFDRKVSIDVAAYYIDWKDIQILSTFTSTVTGVSVTLTGNAGHARSTGFEWSLGWTPVAGLNFTDVGSVTDAKLTVDAVPLGAFKGDALPYVPKLSNTLNVDYRWPVFGDYTAFAGATWQYVGSQYTAFGAPGLEINHFKMPSYNVEDLRFGLERGGYSAELFVRNLANSHAFVGYASLYNLPPGGQGAINIIRPRTVGFRLTAKY